MITGLVILLLIDPGLFYEALLFLIFLAWEI